MSLVITLYQKCILTAEYKESFNMRIPANIETYLATLDKLQVYSGDDIYFTNNGTISIENAGLTTFTSSSYNYMKFSSTYNGVAYNRYCFVKNITLVNEIAVIEYEEDVWTNYSGSMRLRFGNLVQAKKFNTGITPVVYPPRYLPKDYESNLPVKMVSMATIPDHTRCYIIADVSVYKLVAGGGSSFRYTFSCLLGNTFQKKDPLDDSDIGVPTSSYKWYIDNDTLKLITRSKINESNSVCWPNLGTETIPTSDINWRYEILSVKLIPETLGNKLFSSLLTGSGLHKLFNGADMGSLVSRYFAFNDDYGSLAIDTYIISYCGGDEYLNYNGLEGRTILSTSYTAGADYKIKGLINYSRFISFEQNGRDLELTYLFTCNGYSSSLLLNINNEIIDVSSDFVLPLPLSTQNADITQQQAISRSLADMNAAMGQVQTAWNGGMNALKNIGMLNSVGFLDTWVSTGANLTMGAINREPINAAKYATNKGVSITQRAVENCGLDYGFDLAVIDPQNENEVNAYLNKFGYKYNNVYATDSNVFDTDTTDQFVQFSQVAIYGEFSNDIASQLKQILLNGIYIFGSATV